MNSERWKQIDELFDAVLDLPAGEREKFLSEQTGDEDLKNEVLSLLKARTNTDKFLETSAIKIAGRNLAEEGTIVFNAYFLNKIIGTFKIERMLGAGGMGEVYLAQDEKLKRKVALKILPAEYISSDERVRRFQLEARAISTLNHPNIVTIYDVGTFNGINYIATEYVEGKTVRELIKSGVKFNDILSIIIQSCEALSAAHSAGIIHRDIKPENIMVRPDGYIKILDFGLAKLSNISPQTLSNFNKTAKGVIIGTPAYMSPEQVADEKVDHRTDLWSVGVVLYELLTGVNPFKKENRQATFQAILSSQPPSASSLNAEIPAALDQILIKALEKDADLSYQTASDLRADLKRVKRQIDSSPSLRNSSRLITKEEIGKGKSIAALVFGLIILSLIGVGVWFFVIKNIQVIDAPNWTRAQNAQLSDQAGTEFYPSLAPDGKTYVFAMKNQNGNFDIFSQRVGGKNPVNLTQDSRAENSQPVFSPDGEYIAFRSEREPSGIYVMGASGENPRRVADFGFHPGWSPDGKEITVSTVKQDVPLTRSRSAIWIINVESGEKRILIDNYAIQPGWSPNGKFIAFWITESGGRRNVATISSEGGEPSKITDSGNTNWNPVWSPDGNFLYFASDRKGSMAFWRVRIDAETGKPLGEPEVVQTPAKFNRHLSFSRDGKRMIYVQTQNQSDLRSVSFDLKNEKIVGDMTVLTGGNREITHAELSPDGSTFAARQISPTQEDIILLNRDGTIKRELTNDQFFDRYPRWSPDGKKIVFISDRSGKYEIWTINADGTNPKQITDVKDKSHSIPAWSPDGTLISFDNTDESFILDPTKDWNEKNPQKMPAPAENTYFRIWDWSPDGRKLVGYSNPRELNGAMVYDFDTKTFEKFGDSSAINFWLPDSRRIIYANDGKVFIINTETKKPREIEFPNDDYIRQARLSRDGKLLYFSVFNTESDIWLLDLAQN